MNGLKETYHEPMLEFVRRDMLDMLSSAIVHHCQANTVERRDKDLLHNDSLGLLSTSKGHNKTYQSNQASPVVDTKGIEHKLANVELRAADHNGKGAGANDGTIRDSNLVLLIRQECHVHRSRGRHIESLMESWTAIAG